MLKRIAIDNWKCFVNFEHRPGARELWIGENGSGKSSLAECLMLLRDNLRNGVPVGGSDFDSDDALIPFGVESRNKWLTKDQQIIELDLLLEGEDLEYRLSVGQGAAGTRIAHEQMKWAGKTVFEYSDGRIQFASDGDSLVESSLVLDDQVSAVHHLRSTPVSGIRPFRRWLFDVHHYRLLPSEIANQQQSEPHTTSSGSGFVRWLAGIKDLRFSTELFSDLKEAIAGLDNLGFEAEQLLVRFKGPDDARVRRAVPLNFNKLSDGQRILIALYALLRARSNPSQLTIFDEPDAFIAIREIEPWLGRMRGLQEENGSQVIIISHHPEVMNSMQDEAVLFERQANGWPKASRVKPGELPLGELAARGWVEGELVARPRSSSLRRTN